MNGESRGMELPGANDLKVHPLRMSLETHADSMCELTGYNQ